MNPTPRTAPRGFTLVELLVVIAIIALISAVALPMVLPALNERRVSEAARLLQATLAGSRDAAIRANAPRGFRLLPDPGLNPLIPGSLSGTLAMNRLVPIEPAPDYSEGLVSPVFFTLSTTNTQIRVNEVLQNSDGTIANPSSWYWNIRQGDKIRFNDAGPYYTVAGPMKLGPSTGNLERYINNGPPAAVTFPRTSFEYLILTNGQDDDGDGFTDESFDGLDNDNDGIIDPAFNGIDDDADGIIDNEFTFGEYENETFFGTLAAPGALPTGLSYTMLRRPIVSPGAREVTLPAGIVIDLTTWNAPMSSKNTNLTLQPERSRLPVDPYTFFVDILIAPNGQVVQGGPGSAGGDYNAAAPGPNQPFYQFWLTERQDVYSPLWGNYSNYTLGATSGEKDPSIGKVCPIPTPNPNFGTAATSQNFMLPLPKGTVGVSGSAGYPTSTVVYPTTPFLTGERRLVTLFVKTGQITSNSIQSFSLNDTSVPFYDAQSGTKEPQ